PDRAGAGDSHGAGADDRARWTGGVLGGMMLVALLVILTESVIPVPASHWRAIELRVPENSSVVHVSYNVERGSGVQAMVLTRADAERLHRGRSIDLLYA